MGLAGLILSVAVVVGLWLHNNRRPPEHLIAQATSAAAPTVPAPAPHRRAKPAPATVEVEVIEYERRPSLLALAVYGVAAAIGFVFGTTVEIRLLFRQGFVRGRDYSASLIRPDRSVATSADSAKSEDAAPAQIAKTPAAEMLELPQRPTVAKPIEPAADDMLESLLRQAEPIKAAAPVAVSPAEQPAAPVVEPVVATTIDPAVAAYKAGVEQDKHLLMSCAVEPVSTNVVEIAATATKLPLQQEKAEPSAVAVPVVATTSTPTAPVPDPSLSVPVADQQRIIEAARIAPSWTEVEMQVYRTTGGAAFRKVKAVREALKLELSKLAVAA